MDLIYHIATSEDYSKGARERLYTCQSLDSEGFIHCSLKSQLLPVANFLFKGKTNLLLLTIDSAKVEAEIRYENLEGGQQLFPHIYGPLHHEAIIEVTDFKADKDGVFHFPS